MSDATVTKWELPDLFNQKPAAQPHKSRAAATRSEHELGRQDGLEKGYQEGLAAAQQEMTAKLQAVDALMASLSSPLAQMDNQIARELIQLSVKLAETIIHQQVGHQPELVEKQVAEALATLSSKSSDIKLRLHPEDARILKESRPAASADDSESTEYRIVADDSLHRGGCILQTATTLVDATIEKQLRDLMVEMLDSAAQQTQ